MPRRWIACGLLVAATVMLAGCADRENPASGGSLNSTPTGFKDLGGPRDNVLFNLEAAYNERNLTEYNRLLDDDFTFFFSPADVSDGKVSVNQWDRASEINATTNMFNVNFTPPNGSPISSIDLSLVYPEGDNVWNMASPDQNHPGETWYQKSVDYFLTIVAGETTYTSGNPIKAQFTVRRDPDLDIWRIVQWRDDVGGGAARLLTAATEQSTWGNVKALFD